MFQPHLFGFFKKLNLTRQFFLHMIIWEVDLGNFWKKGRHLTKKLLAGDWTYHLSIIIHHGLTSSHAHNHQQFLSGTLIGPNHRGLGTNVLLGSMAKLILSLWS